MDRVILLGWLVLGLPVSACGGARFEAGTGAGAGDGGRLGRIDQHPRCEASGGREVLLDLNQDGRFDVRKVYVSGPEGETLVCREADLNFDGKMDLFVFFDPETGQKRRDEVDLDFTGKVDIVTTYIGGKPIKQELDTNSDGRIDRVRFLDGEVPMRVEGDTTGDGRIDYWEYYEGGKLIRIGMDTTGDGRADTWNRDQETEDAVYAEATGEGEPEGGEQKAAGKGPGAAAQPEKPAKDVGTVDENPF